MGWAGEPSGDAGVVTKEIFFPWLLYPKFDIRFNLNDIRKRLKIIVNQERDDLDEVERNRERDEVVDFFFNFIHVLTQMSTPIN